MRVSESCEVLLNNWVSIWFTRCPDVFINTLNRKRVANFFRDNPSGSLTIIYASELLNHHGQADLQRFLSEFSADRLTLIDFSSPEFFEKLAGETEKSLYDIAKEEIKLSSGGNLAAASDIVRTFFQVTNDNGQLRVYKDFDVYVSFTNNVSVTVSGVTTLGRCNDIIIFPPSQIAKEQREQIQQHILRCYQEFPCAGILKNFENYYFFGSGSIKEKKSLENNYVLQQISKLCENLIEENKNIPPGMDRVKLLIAFREKHKFLLPTLSKERFYTFLVVSISGPDAFQSRGDQTLEEKFIVSRGSVICSQANHEKVVRLGFLSKEVSDLYRQSRDVGWLPFDYKKIGLFPCLDYFNENPGSFDKFLNFLFGINRFLGCEDFKSQINNPFNKFVISAKPPQIKLMAHQLQKTLLEVEADHIRKTLLEVEADSIQKLIAAEKEARTALPPPYFFQKKPPISNTSSLSGLRNNFES